MKQFNLDKETIDQLGLFQSHKQINAPIAADARIFQFPNLRDVYIMESDLYGNPMPKGSCFLAFKGRDGLLGKHMLIDTLKKCTLQDIKKIVENNHNG